MTTKYDIIDEIIENTYKFERLFTQGVRKELKTIFGVKRLTSHKKETLKEVLEKLNTLKCPMDYNQKLLKQLNKEVEKYVKDMTKTLIEQGTDKDDIDDEELYEEGAVLELLAYIKTQVLPIISLLKTEKDEKEWDLDQWEYLSEHNIRTQYMDRESVNSLYPDFIDYYFIFNTGSKKYQIINRDYEEEYEDRFF